MCILIENKAGKFSKTSIKDDELREYANILLLDATNIRENLLHMSAIMATINARVGNGILAQFDDNIATFAEKRLGIKKSQAYNMVNVGEVFLTESGVPRLSQRGGKWSSTQLVALLPMAGRKSSRLTPDETVASCQELIDNGLLSPSMTVAEIKEVVKKYKPGAKVETGTGEETETGTGEENETGKEVMQKIYTMDVCIDKNNNVHVLFNGEEFEYTEENVIKISEYLRNAVNYKA